MIESQRWGTLCAVLATTALLGCDSDSDGEDGNCETEFTCSNSDDCAEGTICGVGGICTKRNCKTADERCNNRHECALPNACRPEFPMCSIDDLENNNDFRCRPQLESGECCSIFFAEHCAGTCAEYLDTTFGVCVGQ